MAEKTVKKTASAKVSKGDAYLCEICGLQLNVDICGDYLKSSGPSCCGHKMQHKATAAKK